MNVQEQKRYQGRPRRRPRHPLRLTALLYLREALQQENYEECAFMIRTAMDFGAMRYEIEALVEDPRRMPSV